MGNRTMIKAIETEYKGYRFRSRLEARWAVFFDALGVEWVYEPEGFDLTEKAKLLVATWRSAEAITNGALWEAPQLNSVFNFVDDWSLGEIEWIEQHPTVLYLPDFWLPSLGKYIDIKPFQGSDFWGNPEYAPIKLLGGYVVHGEPSTIDEGKYEVCVFYDNHHFFGHCDKCHAFSEAFAARNDYVHGTLDQACCGYSRKHDMTTTPMYLEAVRAARSARFEHGERGATPR